MIINSTPDNKASFAGVTEVSEFKIRNSAKAFGILSSGLYANKIRAIVRELSCNALDSHVAAGKRDVPFELHLPTFLEPYFSIRDYGTGLTHDEVINIYTTYFESTKTSSNDFIGALGLGSKSPFSYTDNFSVTAIKDGIKGIYSAFINDNGVPAVALMGQEETTEAPGVEIKFAVPNKEDYDNFRHEVSEVFTYFPQRPKLNIESLKFRSVEYIDENIVPNVHRRANQRYESGNRAIMGNIAYPIDLPRGVLSNNKLTFIDDKSLDFHFGIGEIDFQASREGLQYTERTIRAIEAKYQAVFDILYKKVKEKYDAISCAWEKAQAMVTDSNDYLLNPYVNEYVTKEKPPLVEVGYRSVQMKEFVFPVKKLNDDYNIDIRVFQTNNYWSDTHSTYRMTASESTIRGEIRFNPGYSKNFVFVNNSANEKIWERSKWHFRNNVKDETLVFVIYAKDPTKEAKVDEFYKVLHNPPKKHLMLVSDLEKPERATRDYQKMNIIPMHLPRKAFEPSWSSQPATVDSIKDKKVCWFPLKAYNVVLDDKTYDAKRLFMIANQARGIDALKDVIFVGVRQSEVDAIKDLPTWKRFDVFFKEIFDSINEVVYYHEALSETDFRVESFNYQGALRKFLDKTSPLAVFLDKLKGDKVSINVAAIIKIFGWEDDVKTKREKATAEVTEIVNRYAMLSYIRSHYDSNLQKNLDYIKLVDQMKGQN